MDEIDDLDRRRLETLIASDDSPVGIDAKKTHVLILHLLERIETRLDRLEARLDRDRDAAILRP